MIYVPILKSEKPHRWQMDSVLIAKIDGMFLITDLQVAEKSIRLFFIVEIIDFNLLKRLHTLAACFSVGSTSGLF